MQKKVTAEILKKIQFFRGNGYNQKEIAAKVGISQTVVSNHLSNIKKECERHG